jgi:branched-chain amino acid transport system permease protein
MLIKITLDNWDYIGGVGGLSLPLIQIPLLVVKFPFYYYMLLIAIAAVYMSYRIRHSKFVL